MVGDRSAVTGTDVGKAAFGCGVSAGDWGDALVAGPVRPGRGAGLDHSALRRCAVRHGCRNHGGRGYRRTYREGGSGAMGGRCGGAGRCRSGLRRRSTGRPGSAGRQAPRGGEWGGSGPGFGERIGLDLSRSKFLSPWEYAPLRDRRRRGGARGCRRQRCRGPVCGPATLISGRKVPTTCRNTRPTCGIFVPYTERLYER